MTPSKPHPFERIPVAYLGSYMAGGIIYTLTLTKVPMGLYYSELQFVRCDGYIAGASAPRFYDSDLQACNGERVLLYDFLMKAHDCKPEDVVTLHYGDYKVDEYVTVNVDPEYQSLEKWSVAVADKAIADAARGSAA